MLWGGWDVRCLRRADQVGDDAAGAEYARRLLDAGVTPFLAQSARGTPTAEAVSVVSSDGQRTMRPFLGAATEYTVADLPMAELRRCSLLHMEGCVAPSQRGDCMCGS